MNRKNASPIPEPIVQLQRQLDQFRSTQQRRTKFPEALWQAAGEVGRQHRGPSGAAARAAECGGVAVAGGGGVGTATRSPFGRAAAAAGLYGAEETAG